MKTKHILIGLTISAVIVGGYFYFKDSDKTVEKKDESEEEGKSECGGCLEK